MSWLRPIDLWLAERVLPHEAELLRQARRWAIDDGDARDLLHDAYAQLLQLTAWEQIANPVAYAVRTIRNEALQRHRRAQIAPMRPLDPLEEVQLPDPAPDGFAIAAARREMQLLEAALAGLPPQPRRVLLLRKFEQLAPREIAERLGISLSTVEKHLARGMLLLSRAMRASGSEWGGATGETEPAARRSAEIPMAV